MKGNLLRSSPLPTARAARRRVDVCAALHVGLAEIGPLVFGATGPDPASGPNPSRSVLVSDISNTGLRIDGAEDECADIAPGDFVALSVGRGLLMLGTVVRVVPNVGPGRIVMGVRRLPALWSHLLPQAA
jgi:hypothetical protein